MRNEYGIVGRMPSNNDENRGLYEKFRVWRTDGSSDVGGKHEHCRYFVLDLTHDPYAIQRSWRTLSRAAISTRISQRTWNETCSDLWSKITMTKIISAFCYWWFRQDSASATHLILECTDQLSSADLLRVEEHFRRERFARGWPFRKIFAEERSR